MGRSSEAACLDCKEHHYFGSGSYTTWLDNLESTKAFDEAPEELKKLSKNQAWRAFLSVHEGHNYVRWDEDCEGWFEIPDTKGFTFVDHTKIRRESESPTT